MDQTLPRYMNYQQTMQLIGIGSYVTLNKYIKKYGLKVTVIENKKFIDREEVVRFMRSYAI